jgi:hypothetical protein
MATTRRSKAKRKTPAKARKRTAATRRKAAARPARKQSARGKRTAASSRKAAARPAGKPAARRPRSAQARSEPKADNQTGALGTVEQMFDQAAKKTKRAARKVKNEIKDMLNM